MNSQSKRKISHARTQNKHDIAFYRIRRQELFTAPLATAFSDLNINPHASLPFMVLLPDNVTSVVTQERQGANYEPFTHMATLHLMCVTDDRGPTLSSSPFKHNLTLSDADDLGSEGGQPAPRYTSV